MNPARSFFLNSALALCLTSPLQAQNRVEVFKEFCYYPGCYMCNDLGEDHPACKRCACRAWRPKTLDLFLCLRQCERAKWSNAKIDRCKAKCDYEGDPDE